MRAAGQPLGAGCRAEQQRRAVGGRAPGGGASAAGASVQNPPAPSPATNEQLRSHAPRGSHHGMNFSGP